MIKKVRVGILVSVLSLHFSLPSFAMDTDDHARSNQARRYTKEDVIAAQNHDLDYVNVRRQMTAITLNFTSKGAKTGFSQRQQLEKQMQEINEKRTKIPVPQMPGAVLMSIWNSDNNEGVYSYYRKTYPEFFTN